MNFTLARADSFIEPRPALRSGRVRRRVWSLVLGLTFITSAQAQLTNYSHVHTFGRGNAKGIYPYAGLCEGSDGALYGVAREGGRQNAGTLFRLNKDGSGFTVLHHFGASPGDGRNAPHALIEGTDGFLYGVTSGGGQWKFGTVFRIQKNGTGYEILHSFTGTPVDGAAPSIGLMEASDGALYGAGGIVGAGLVATIFKLEGDGSNFSIVRKFRGPDEPHEFGGALVEGTNGMLYGASAIGGDFGPGAVFRLNKDGSDLSVVRHFGTFFVDGTYPSSGLLLSTNGRFYGNTLTGGINDQGLLFAVDHEGFSSWNVRSFTSFSGKNPSSVLARGLDGYLYGTTERGGTNDSGVVFKIRHDGNGYAVLHRFNYRTGDGERSSGGLIQASDGALYGTTPEGGSAGRGTIYKLQPDGSGYQILVQFDGEAAGPVFPVQSLVEADDRRLYGAANEGGSYYKGAIFSVNKDGSDFTILHSFGPTTDFFSLSPRVINSRNGPLYGTTAYGGISNVGTLFRLDKNGSNYTALHHFTAQATNGTIPTTALLEASDGFLYGTTASGSSNGFGTVFRIGTDGSGFAAIHSFSTNINDVRFPGSALVEGTDGLLYGTARTSTSSMFAAVFKLSKDGNGFTNFAVFYGGRVQGENQELRTTLMEASDEWLYGTSSAGGPTNAAFIFKVNKEGNGYAVIHDFLGGPVDGNIPRVPMVEGRDGALYGVTSSGGAFNGGTLFKLNKDGSGYAVLRNYPANGAGGYRPELPLVAGADGAFYGATPGGPIDPNDLNAISGFLFRFGHALALEFANGSPKITVTGVPGYEYELEHSTDLATWSVAEMFVLPANGTVQFATTNAPFAAFFRVRAK